MGKLPKPIKTVSGCSKSCFTFFREQLSRGSCTHLHRDREVRTAKKWLISENPILDRVSRIDQESHFYEFPFCQECTVTLFMSFKYRVMSDRFAGN